MRKDGIVLTTHIYKHPFLWHKTKFTRGHNSILRHMLVTKNLCGTRSRSKYIFKVGSRHE